MYYFDPKFDVRVYNDSFLLRNGDRCIRLDAPDDVHKKLLCELVNGCDLDEFLKTVEDSDRQGIKTSIGQLSNAGYIVSNSHFEQCRGKQYSVKVIDRCGILRPLNTEWKAVDDVAQSDAILMVLAGDSAEQVLSEYQNFVHGSIPVIPITPFDGQYAIVGPVSMSAQSACAHCLFEWHRASIKKAEPYYTSAYLLSQSRNFENVNGLVNSLVSNVLKEVCTQNVFVYGKALLVNYRMGLPLVECIDALKMPRCSVCSSGIEAGRLAPFFEEEK